MRFLTLSGIALLICCSFAYTQTREQEFTILRDHLVLPGSTRVKLNRSLSISIDPPFKVYIATGKDKDPHKNILRWIEEWNKKDGDEFGAIEVVSELQQAQIILSRCNAFFDTHSRTLRGIGQGLGFSGLYVYVIESREGGLEILHRNTHSTDDSLETVGRTLWEDFQRMVKRGKKEKEKQKK
jgi:hypothetical protein